jgi:hypothetical protein
MSGGVWVTTTPMYAGSPFIITHSPTGVTDRIWAPVALEKDRIAVRNELSLLNCGPVESDGLTEK